MKTQTHPHLVIRSGLALAFALAIWSPSQLQSAEPMAGKMMMDNKMMPDGKMMEHCQEMQVQKQKMMAEMKAQDAALTEQVAKMNAAPEGQKVSLIAGVVTRLVEQRAAMHAQMEKMQASMMQHMMQHMQMGKESMSQCPMMKGMKGMDDKSGDAPVELK